jgi:hypothetical protein
VITGIWIAYYRILILNAIIAPCQRQAVRSKVKNTRKWNISDIVFDSSQFCLTGMINFSEQCILYAAMLTLCLDIILKLEDTGTNSKYQTLNMTELVAIGLPDGPDGIHIPLIQNPCSPREWKAKGFLML